MKRIDIKTPLMSVGALGMIAKACLSLFFLGFILSCGKNNLSDNQKNQDSEMSEDVVGPPNFGEMEFTEEEEEGGQEIIDSYQQEQQKLAWTPQTPAGYIFHKIAFTAYASPVRGAKPVYRLYHPYMDWVKRHRYENHYYTTSKGLVDRAVNKFKYTYEGIAWYSKGPTKVFSLWSDNSLNQHLAAGLPEAQAIVDNYDYRKSGKTTKALCPGRCFKQGGVPVYLYIKTDRTRTDSFFSTTGF